ncbi:MAG: hypothetical protein ACHQ51_09965 [Elusimicrobiota bacterium]
MLAALALTILAPLAAAAPAPIPIHLTAYATPRERDFGNKPSQRVRWQSPLDGRLYWSLFVPGFADRDSQDPLVPDASGAAMEGSGWIDPALHTNDRALAAALAKGYRVLVLERWDANKRTASFSLAKKPLASDGSPLREGVSAAVRARNGLFPDGRRVRIACGGRSLGERRIHDECSSCEDDGHIDLYVAASTAAFGELKDCTAVLLPK